MADAAETETLRAYEEKFANRFTTEDQDYQQYFTRPADSPPIVEDWVRGRGRDRFQDQRGHRGRGWGGGRGGGGGGGWGGGGGGGGGDRGWGGGGGDRGYGGQQDRHGHGSGYASGTQGGYNSRPQGQRYSQGHY